MSDIRGMFPRVGLKGRFTFSGPFEEYNNLDMEVIADKSFGYYVTRGRDLLEEIYFANGLTEETFNNHRTIGVRAVTFRHHGTLIVDIPSIYITSIPDDELGFEWFQIIASLGVLPKDIDLTRVKEDVKDILLQNMGINTEVLISTSSITDNFTIEDLEVQEQVRKNAVKNTSTLLKDKMMLERRVLELETQVNDLMNIIYDADIRQG